MVVVIAKEHFFLRGIAYINASKFEQALADLNRTLEYNRNRGAAILARGNRLPRRLCRPSFFMITRSLKTSGQAGMSLASATLKRRR